VPLSDGSSVPGGRVSQPGEARRCTRAGTAGALQACADACVPPPTMTRLVSVVFALLARRQDEGLEQCGHLIRVAQLGQVPGG